jgi:hypothetical protein
MWDNVLRTHKESLTKSEGSYLTKARSNTLRTRALASVLTFVNQASTAPTKKTTKHLRRYGSVLGQLCARRLMSKLWTRRS